ncbi:MAG: cysteine--tRNA ligase [Bacteroidales bacterium]|nr:cysteine--tRNA ligase [Bacteroidales bacterium]
MREFYITNTLSRQKELFKPLVDGHVGLYVCGPTVYGDAHLGHARPGVTYDVFTRLLRHLGYKVRYVRNITDVGHLENDADSGEDKIAKKARLEELEPMEVVQRYTLRYHEAMRELNVAPPSIEPHASGHIIEQIELVKSILDAGYAYVSNGSVYFDVAKYNSEHKYGILSGRTLEDSLVGTRDLDGGEDKHNPWDFALWKKAAPEHIMKWPSPWSIGFPGWHLECSAMSAKYLGRTFDIHGGGMDLMFPHHECELAQNTASRGEGGVRYWMHNNMVTINGRKMGKSLGNFITLGELFSGSHELLEQAYTPMTIRFFILQAHYRSTLDFSNEALQASQKGLERLLAAAKDLRTMAEAAGVTSSVVGTEGHSADKLSYGEFVTDIAPETFAASEQVVKIAEGIYEALCDDLNTPIAISLLFEAVKMINTAKERKGMLSKEDMSVLLRLFDDIVYGVLGLSDGESGDGGKLAGTVSGLMEMVLAERKRAKEAKDWAKSDSIRDSLNTLGITVKDTKDGVEWLL